ncbi:MAG: P-loop NTPase [Armatimonadota bacterium]
MNWLRYSGRIILALGVVAIALWATREQLIDIPVYHFWVGILCYLIAAEVVWTLVERASARDDSASTTAGFLKFPPSVRANTSPDWLYDGGRVRLDDIAAGNDVIRDSHQGLLASVLTREARPRLHLVCGEAATGRSTMLLRLGRTLADQQHPVFLALTGANHEELSTILTAARKTQVYLLIDDLDLRPQAEDWLYEIFRARLPVVVVATVRDASYSPQHYGLDALQPANLLSAATRHAPTLTANDLGSLARKLSALDRQQRANLALEENSNLMAAMRRLQGRDPAGNLWQELDQGASLPLRQKVMVALCGTAELAIPRRIGMRLLGEKSLAQWQRAGLLKEAQGLLLPPHRNVCLSLLTELPDQEAVSALQQLLEHIAPEPALALRLLFALANTEQTATLARQILAQQTLLPQSQWSEELQRQWRRILQACDLPSAPPDGEEQPPTELARLAGLAFNRQAYETALELYCQLSSVDVYHSAARFNLALTCARLERWEEATQQLERQTEGPCGTDFLQGLIAEANGDYLAALEAYERSRQADQLQLASTLRLAFCRLRTGSPRTAIPLFEAVLAHAPLLAEVYGGLAVALHRAGMGQRAAAQSARAIQAGLDPLLAHKAVAQACADQYAFDRAALELEACVNYAPDDLDSWRNLAVACRCLGRFRREEECLRRVQLVAREDTENLFQMARCERDQGRANETLQLLEPLLQAAPTVRVFLLAAEAAGSEGDRESQRRYASEALAHGDDSGWGHYWLADALAENDPQRREAYATAIAAFQSLLADGVTPRRAARLWQALYQAATQIGNDRLAAEALRKGRQEASACAALAVEIESVTHRRSVPADIFLETLAPVSTTEQESTPRKPSPNPPAPPLPNVATGLGGRTQRLGG